MVWTKQDVKKAEYHPATGGRFAPLHWAHYASDAAGIGEPWEVMAKVPRNRRSNALVQAVLDMYNAAERVQDELRRLAPPEQDL